MPDQLTSASVLVRAFSVLAALLIAIPVASLPATAAPAYDDDLIVTDLTEGDESATESTDEAEHEVAEPVQDAAEPAAETADDSAEASDETADEASEATDEPVHAEEEAAPVEAAAAQEVVAAPIDAYDEVDDAFLRRLLDAINERRRRNGTQLLSFVPASANSALDSYLAEKVGECDHRPVHGAFSWDVVQAAGFGGDPRGEVIACEGGGSYWTPDRTAERWWDSPIHHDVLYSDGDSNAIACSAYGVQGGSSDGGKKKRKSSGSPDAASAVLCVTFRG